MINFFNQVPSVYSDASRDFQYIGWLINIVLNSVKHNVDDLYDLPNIKSDPRLTEILAMTLGFKVKRNYDQKQLAALVSIIPSVLKYKGTAKAVTIVGEVLLRATGSSGMFECEVKDNCLEVLLPKDLVDITLFLDLLPYILPAGLTCRIVRKTQIQKSVDAIKLGYEDVLRASWHRDVDWDNDAQTSTGLTNLFDVDANNDVSFAGHKKLSDNLNTGLLDNSVVPLLDRTLIDPKSNNLGDKET